MNDGFLRKKSFINFENFQSPLILFCTVALANRLESIRKSYERFRDLSLNLAMIVTFVDILSAFNKVVISQFETKNGKQTFFVS